MTEQIVIEFDRPQAISRLIYEAEECECERTQEVRVGASCDRGATYKQVLVQEYTFSPQGATFEREDLVVSLAGITHLRLEIVPNKRGAGAATRVGAGPNAPFADLARERRAESVPPEPNGLMADIDPAFEQQVLDLA